MKVIFVTMGSFIKVFHSVYESLQSKTDIESVGFYVSHKRYFTRFSNETSLGDIPFLKEWECVEQGLSGPLDTGTIERVERTYFCDEPIWKSLLNDRRIFLGQYAKVTQDYRPSYTRDEMLRIFQATATAIELFIDRIRPDLLVMCNAPTTYGEYIFYRIAQAKKLLCLILRPTKIKNYCTFTTDFLHHDHVYNDYKQFLSGEGTISDDEYRHALDYIDHFSKKGESVYEGSVGNTLHWSPAFILEFIKSIGVDLKHGFHKKDHHSHGSETVRFLYDKPIRFLRAHMQHSRLAGVCKTADDLTLTPYVFYPLHAEPEVSTTLYANHLQNQIEVVRTIAMQLPSSLTLFVKEHPRSIGRRSMNYYRKLLEIPNVRLVDPLIPSVLVTRNAALVIVLTGFVGLETVFNKKPVITLGRAEYTMLPKHMVNYVEHIQSLHNEIKWSLAHYAFDEKALNAYIYAQIKNAVSLYLYSVLLNKKRSAAVTRTEEKYHENIETLTTYLLKRFQQERAALVSPETNTAGYK